MKVVSNHRCAYIGCHNTQRHTKKIAYFRFPVKNKERCEQWIKNCGNVHLTELNYEQLKNKVLCETHFDSDDYKVSNLRKLLFWNAVPFLFNAPRPTKVPKKPPGQATKKLPELSPSKNVPKKRTTTLQELWESKQLKTYERNLLPKLTKSTKIKEEKNPSQSTSKQTTAKSETTNEPKQNEPKQNKKRLTRKKRFFASRTVLENLLRDRGPAVKTLVYMQRFRRSKPKWTKSEKKLAISLYHKSPTGYEYMYKKLRFVLPPINTIKNWLTVRNLKAGLSTTFMSQFAQKVNVMDKLETHCVVLFDELVLETDSDDAHEDNKERHTSTALVVYLRGLLYKWETPFCFFILSESDDLHCLIKIVLEKIIDMNLKPRVLLSKQSSNSERVFICLGASQENPVIAIKNNKIYTCFDTPCLIASLRNNFIDPKLKFIVRDRPISWLDFIKTYDIDRQNDDFKLIKITKEHIQSNEFHGTQIKCATELFSNTVSSAILSAVATQQLSSNTATDTALFFKLVNNVFDCLNSSVVTNSNVYKSALSIYNDIPQKTLQEAIEYFQNIKVFEVDQLREDVYCLEGFRWTINSILLLWHDLQEDGRKYLLTARINRDPLEKFFSVLRNGNGSLLAPSVSEFKMALQREMSACLLKPIETPHCEIDDEESTGLTDKMVVWKVIQIKQEQFKIES